MRADALVRGERKHLQGRGDTGLREEAQFWGGGAGLTGTHVSGSRAGSVWEGQVGGAEASLSRLKASTPPSSRFPPPPAPPPAGWDAETGGGDSEDGLRPDVLVSLAAPKRCAGRFSGRHHFVAGRFVPDDVRRKFALRLPGYTGTDCVAAL